MTVLGVPRLARVVRTAVAAGASLEGFSVDEVDDLRLLVDEAFVALCDAGSHSVRLRLDLVGGCVVLEMRGDTVAEPVDTSVLRALATVLAIQFEIAFEDAPPRFAATLRAAA